MSLKNIVMTDFSFEAENILNLNYGYRVTRK